MSYTIERRKDISSVVVIVGDDFSMKDELHSLCEEAWEIFEQANSPLFYISDASNLSLSFEELVQATNVLVRGEYPFATHRNFKALFVVSNDPLISEGAKGMSSDAFGNVWVEIFTSLDAAIEFIRAQH